MSLGNTFENDLVKLIFQATAIANMADNAGTSPLTNLYVALHTADPGETGDQTTSETAYTDYARVAVARSGSGWDVTANVASNVAEILFPLCGATPGGNLTHVSVGTAATSTGKILASGALSAAIPLTASVTQPRFAAGQLTFTLD